MKKIISSIMLISIIFSICIPVFSDNIDDNNNINYSQAKDSLNFYDAILDDEFSGDGVIYVTMHHDVSDVGKIYTQSDFPEIEIENIFDITSANINSKKEDYGPDFKNILKIILVHKDRDGVISSIEKLQFRANVDIYWVEPSYKLTCTEEVIIDNSEPVFNDTYYPSQKWVYDIIGLTDVWSEFDIDCNSLKVAIVDRHGVKQHEDIELESEINLYGSDFNYQTAGNHGTSCAGIVGATQNNGKWVAGKCELFVNLRKNLAIFKSINDL